jgi:hypothetical protein
LAAFGEIASPYRIGSVCGMIHDMLDHEYRTTVCSRLDSAEAVPFEKVSIGEWEPQFAHCHENVDVWVRAHPQCKPVRGWLIYASFSGGAVGLTAHSIVKGADGKLYDITPFGDESVRPYARFIAHGGDDHSFFEIKAKGHSFTCPPNLMENMALERWKPTDGDLNLDSEYFDDIPDSDS